MCDEVNTLPGRAPLKAVEETGRGSIWNYSFIPHAADFSQEGPKETQIGVWIAS